MTAISREMQYLQAHRQAEDTRRLRELWQQAAGREAVTRRLPWLLRGAAVATGILWLAAALIFWGLTAAIVGMTVLVGLWCAAEWRWRPPPRSGSLAWELDRLNPQFEGAFCLLDWLDAVEGPARGPRQAVLEVTLARVQWHSAVVTPDRRCERRYALRQIALLAGWIVLGLLVAWWYRPTPLTPSGDATPVLALTPPPPVRSVGALRIVDLTVRVEPPLYTGLPTQETYLPTIQAPAGSRVTVRWRVETDNPAAAQSWVRMGDRRLTAPQPGTVAEWSVTANVPSGEAAIEAQAGAPTARLPLYLAWRDDRAPHVEVNVPEKIERDREGIRFQLHVEDDYGLTQIEVLVSTQSPPGAPTTRVEKLLLPLAPGQDSLHQTVLVPSEILERLRQDRLRLQVKAFDGRTDMAGKPQPNVGVTDPADFLVVQPWDNARKPRSLDRRQGADGGDQSQTGESDDGGGGTPNSSDGMGPRMLQKNPDEPAGPQQSQPNNDGGAASKYNQMAGSQGDTDRRQPDRQSQPKPTDQGGDRNGDSPPNPQSPPEPGANNPAGQEGAGNGSSAPSTDGVKNPESLPPPTAPSTDNRGQPAAGADSGADRGPQPGSPRGDDAPPPPANPPPGDGASGNQQGGHGGGLPPTGAGGSHSESRSRPVGSQQTAPDAKGNAAADSAVSAQATTSVDEALRYAREKPLGAWQRNFGGRGGPDRVVQSADNVAGGNRITGNDGGASRVGASATAAGLTEDNLAAERAQLEQRHAERIEQYLLFLRREAGTSAPATR